MTVGLDPVVRELGPRGSKSEIAGPDPAAELPYRARQVLAAVPEWWKARAEAAGLEPKWQSLESALELPLPAAIDGVDPVPDLVGLSPENLGDAYLGGLSAQIRARHGRHYTPSSLAAELWAMARRGLGHRAAARQLTGLVRDPACGAGALLLPPLREHIASVRGSDPQVALAGLDNVIEGVDTDPAAVWLANVVLAAELLPMLAAVPTVRRRPLPALVRLGDGLMSTGRKARAVVMNPPYGRVRISPQERERFQDVLYGHANLYALFIAAAVEDLDESGVLAALVPTSFTSGLYFQNLRKAMSEVAPLREVAFVAQRGDVFAGVLQETCLAVFTRREPHSITLTTLNGSVTRVAEVKAPRGEGPWLLPRQCEDAAIAAAAVAMPLNLAAVGWKASTGPLVWNRRKPDLHRRRGSRRAHIVWAADIDGGVLHRDPARDDLRYLALTQPSDETVMLLRTPAILVQRTTAPEQARRLVLAELTPDDLSRYSGRVVVENHVNVLRPVTDKPAISQRTLARVLATLTLDRVMRCLSGSVAVSAYELESLPLPGHAVLEEWETLSPVELNDAVTAAYRPVVP